MQQCHGGSTALHEPAPDEIAFAEKVLKLCPGAETCAYARVDIVRGHDGKQLLLMEVELLEPLLWLALAPHAVDALAAHLAAIVAK